MSAEWRTAPLRELCTLINGRAYKRDELLDSGKYPVLRVGNFFTSNHWYFSDLELPDDKYCESGDLLYAWSASFGPRIWSGARSIYHYHIWKVVPDLETVTKQFLFYFLQWDATLAKSEHGAGTTMTHVSMGSMYQRMVPVPPLAEQQRIVGILDEAFEGIATAKAAVAKQLNASAVIVDSHVSTILDSRESVSTIVPLGDLASFKNGVNFNTRSRGARVTLVGVGDFAENMRVPVRSLASVTVEGELSPELFLQSGDILTVRSNGSKQLVGRCMLVGDDIGVATFSGFVIRIRPDRKQIRPLYLLEILKSNRTRAVLTSSGGGANISNINQGKLAALEIPLPSISVQDSICSSVGEIREESTRLADLLTAKLAALDALKQSLLHHAFAGQL